MDTTHVIANQEKTHPEFQHHNGAKSHRREWTLYTDGSCLHKGHAAAPSPGGWAVRIDGPEGTRWLTGAATHTWPHMMELTAATRALRALSRGAHATLVTDCQEVASVLAGKIKHPRPRHHALMAAARGINLKVIQILGHASGTPEIHRSVDRKARAMARSAVQMTVPAQQLPLATSIH